MYLSPPHVQILHVHNRNVKEAQCYPKKSYLFLSLLKSKKFISASDATAICNIWVFWCHRGHHKKNLKNWNSLLMETLHCFQIFT